jgi:hypothetical protein
MNQMNTMNSGSPLFSGQRELMEMALMEASKPMRKPVRMAAAGAEYRAGHVQIMSPDEQMDKKQALQLYVHAAFCFLHGLLWNGEQWADSEAQKALRQVELFFKHTQDRDGAFVTLAGRALAAHILNSKLDKMELMAALVHPSGLCSEPRLCFSRQHAKAIKMSRVHQVGLPILIRHYLQYVAEPGADIIMAMKVELDNVEFGELMQIFYDVVNAEQPEI